MLKTAHLLRIQKVSGLEPSQDRAEVFEQFRRLAILDRSRVHEIQVYDSLFLAITVDAQVSLPQTATLLRIGQARLDLGVSKDEYVEILEHLITALQGAESPSVADIALEEIPSTVAHCDQLQPEEEEYRCHPIVLFVLGTAAIQ